MEATVPSSPAPRNLSRYWLATRPYAYTAALVPVLIGTAAARFLFPSLSVIWIHFALVLLGSIAIQAVSNVVNDYYDAKWGLDNPDNNGRMNALVSHLITFREAKGLIAFCAVIAGLIGLYFVSVVGGPITGLLAVGVVLAIGYTAPPLKLKYRAMGDLAVIAGFGFGMSLGAYMVQAYGQPAFLSLPALAKLAVYTLPSALLVVAILHTNNHRDRGNDIEFGARTLGNVLSPQTSKGLLFGLLLMPYALVAVEVATGYGTPWWALVLLAVPPLGAVLKRVRADEFEGMLVPDVAKLHGIFGLLTALAICLAVLR
ncbi:1,4-dihydroxy-2-naphthoate polyprenyltransferase [soil metagenome]